MTVMVSPLLTFSPFLGSCAAILPSSISSLLIVCSSTSIFRPISSRITLASSGVFPSKSGAFNPPPKKPLAKSITATRAIAPTTTAAIIIGFLDFFEDLSSSFIGVAFIFFSFFLWGFISSKISSSNSWLCFCRFFSWKSSTSEATKTESPTIFVTKSMFPNSSIISSVLLYRLDWNLSVAFITSFSNAGGMPDTRWDGGVISSLMCMSATCTGFSPSKGTWPVSIS